MVFVDPKNLGYRPYWERWVNAIPSEQDRKAFIALFEKYVPQCISMILEGVVDGRQGEKLSTIVPVTNLNMVILVYVYAVCDVTSQLLTAITT